MRKTLIKNIVCRDRGLDGFNYYSSYRCTEIDVLSEPVQSTLASVPPTFGSCVMISTGLAAALQTHYSIPAIVVLGTLSINGSSVFECKENIPLSNDKETIKESNWDGHCWVEIDGIICDLSIFRSAYRVSNKSVLNSYIRSNFGKGKGAILSRIECLPKGLEFIPKFVLNDNQISAVLAGLSEQCKAFNKNIKATR